MSDSFLILGGARSGKSGYAKLLAEEISQRPIFLATAEALDAEMAARIARHQGERGDGWQTIECPLDICQVLSGLANDDVIVIDCLTLWLSNLLHHERSVDQAIDELCSYIEESDQCLVFVSNEVGLGLVPENALGRRFRDYQGQLNQSVAHVVDRVRFLAAGLPLELK